MEPRKLDPRHSGELLKHMDKQKEVLMETYRLLLHQLHTLQVEHETLMSNLYKVMSTNGLVKKNDSDSSAYDNGVDLSSKEVDEANEDSYDNGDDLSNKEVNEANEEQ